MKTITIDGHLRTENGKKVARQLRSQDNVLAVIYGGATEVNFYAPAKAFKSLVYTSEFQLADVTVEGKTYKCILKDLQFDKVTDALIHVDLLELVNDKKVIATLPLKMVGVSVGVKAGGKLIVKMKSLKVKALPKNLPDFVEANISELEMGNKLYVTKLVSDKYKLMHPDNTVVCQVRISRAAMKAAQEAAKAAKAPAKGKKK